MCEALRELFADELKEKEEVGLERGALLMLISQVRKNTKRVAGNSDCRNSGGAGTSVYGSSGK